MFEMPTYCLKFYVFVFFKDDICQMLAEIFECYKNVEEHGVDGLAQLGAVVLATFKTKSGSKSKIKC